MAIKIELKCIICGKVSKGVKEIREHSHPLSEFMRIDINKESMK